MKMWTGDIHQHDNNMDVLKTNLSKQPADVKEDMDSVTKEVTVMKSLKHVAPNLVALPFLFQGYLFRIAEHESLFIYMNKCESVLSGLL